MEIVLSALLYLCVNDIDCEMRVHHCFYKSEQVRIEQEIEVTPDYQSEVFQYCFETSVMEEEL